VNDQSEPGSLVAATDPYDRAELLERMGGDLEGVRELIDIYLEDLPSLQQELEDAGADLTRLARVAHTLKGSSANLAATRVPRAAATVEADARAGRQAEAEAGRRQLADLVRDLAAALGRDRAGSMAEPS